MCDGCTERADLHVVRKILVEAERETTSNYITIHPPGHTPGDSLMNEHQGKVRRWSWEVGEIMCVCGREGDGRSELDPRIGQGSLDRTGTTNCTTLAGHIGGGGGVSDTPPVQIP